MRACVRGECSVAPLSGQLSLIFTDQCSRWSAVFQQNETSQLHEGMWLVKGGEGMLSQCFELCVCLLLRACVDYEP